MDIKIMFILLGCLCVAFTAKKSAPKPVDEKTKKIATDAFAYWSDEVPFPPQQKCGMKFLKLVPKSYQTEDDGDKTTYYFTVDIKYNGYPDDKGKQLVVSVPKARSEVVTNPCGDAD
ncbi:uncharacterized protein LOC129589871 [Paramacrobiotus metropolitanus]|uniref:uncharacterized protein LOC129589871 n=1 Tax=Paramacrobiotus metropolitanus TaxID=2943436 RepID=UPI002445E4D7|nr:uncharacterized protein LOC129589871 [Paramacrobiotus metropolitanus]